MEGGGGKLAVEEKAAEEEAVEKEAAEKEAVEKEAVEQQVEQEAVEEEAVEEEAVATGRPGGRVLFVGSVVWLVGCLLGWLVCVVVRCIGRLVVGGLVVWAGERVGWSAVVPLGRWAGGWRSCVGSWLWRRCVVARPSASAWALRGPPASFSAKPFLSEGPGPGCWSWCSGLGRGPALCSSCLLLFPGANRHLGHLPGSRASVLPACRGRSPACVCQCR